MEAHMKRVWQWVTAVILSASILAGSAIADDIALTVYNSNLGVVREIRNLTFEKGPGRIAFTDVAAQIDATSVTFEMVDTTLAVDILEQNYAYDLVSPDKIYGKYIDQNVDIITEKGELFSGTLLSYNGGYLIDYQAGRRQNPVGGAGNRPRRDLPRSSRWADHAPDAVLAV